MNRKLFILATLLALLALLLGASVALAREIGPDAREHCAWPAK